MFQTSSYFDLPGRCYSIEAPEWSLKSKSAGSLQALCWNRELAIDLGLAAGPEGLTDEQELLRQLTGLAVPGPTLALAYAGHQFGHFVPRLGDGRAIVLGEREDNAGLRWDVQLKGSGRTCFSRGGDGCLPFHAALKEFLYSKAMNALGAPGSQSLSVLPLDFAVYRSVPPPARQQQAVVLSRISRCHLRVGSFEYFAARRDTEALRALADYLIRRIYPELEHLQAAVRYRALAESIAGRLALLVAHWQALGFVHGVLNTDNISLCGETIDYGPCAFLDEYREAACFSSIDATGRYAFGQQPAIMEWNLRSLLYCLSPLFSESGSDTTEALSSELLAGFRKQWKQHWYALLLSRLGFASWPAATWPVAAGQQASEEQIRLLSDFLALLEREGCDYHAGFWGLLAELQGPGAATESPLSWFTNFPGFQSASWQDWLRRWRAELCRAEGSRGEQVAAARIQAHSPLFVPRNHWLESAIRQAEEGDWTLYHALLAAVSQPYWRSEAASDQSALRQFCQSPAALQGADANTEEAAQFFQTYCGT